MVTVCDDSFKSSILTLKLNFPSVDGQGWPRDSSEAGSFPLLSPHPFPGWGLTGRQWPWDPCRATRCLSLTAVPVAVLWGCRWNSGVLQLEMSPASESHKKFQAEKRRVYYNKRNIITLQGDLQTLGLGRRSASSKCSAVGVPACRCFSRLPS